MAKKAKKIKKAREKKLSRADKLALALFAKTLSILQRSGVPILDGMDITARTSPSRGLRDAIMQARSSMREGEGIAGPFKATGQFPRVFIQMVSAGEETGKLDEMLDKLGEYFMSEAEGRKVDDTTALWQQLATMQSAGLPLVQCCGICAENIGGKLGAALKVVGDDIAAGGNFSEALAKHPKVFDPLSVNMAKAGEMGGNLDVILQRLCDLREFMLRGTRRG